MLQEYNKQQHDNPKQAYNRESYMFPADSHNKTSLQNAEKKYKAGVFRSNGVII